MSVRRSVAEILSQHVTLELESIDRMYLNLYVPQLQHEAGAVFFFRAHRGQTFASSVLMAAMSRAFVAAIDQFVRRHDLPVVRFARGQRKDEVALEHLARFRGEEGILFVGIAQEKSAVFRTEKRRNPVTGAPYPWIIRSTAMVNAYYFYGVDHDFGPFFLKFCSYFPYTAKFCLNGPEYLKRQATRQGLSYEALDNGILGSPEPGRLQTISPSSRRPGSRPASGDGWPACRIPSRPRMGPLATATRSPSCRRSSRSRRSWTDP